MVAIDIVLCFVGLLYAFAGFCVAFSALREHLLDEALDAVFFENPDPVDKTRELVMLFQGVLVFSGGVTLALFLNVAAWIFSAASIFMALVLFWIAPRYLGAMSAQEYKRSIYALVAYAAATAIVLWAWSEEKLLGWNAAPWPLLAFAAGIIVAFCSYLVWTWVKSRKESLLNSDEG